MWHKNTHFNCISLNLYTLHHLWSKLLSLESLKWQFGISLHWNEYLLSFWLVKTVIIYYGDWQIKGNTNTRWLFVCVLLFNLSQSIPCTIDVIITSYIRIRGFLSYKKKNFFILVMLNWSKSSTHFKDGLHSWLTGMFLWAMK